jgi:hypothetical protein
LVGGEMRLEAIGKPRRRFFLEAQNSENFIYIIKKDFFKCPGS